MREQPFSQPMNFVLGKKFTCSETSLRATSSPTNILSPSVKV